MTSHLTSELVVGLTAHRLFNNKIGDLYVKLLREIELIQYYVYVNIIFQLLKIDYFPKKSVIVACFFVLDRLSVSHYDNNTTRQILLPVLTRLCHFKFFLLLAMSQRSLVDCGVSKKTQS